MKKILNFATAITLLLGLCGCAEINSFLKSYKLSNKYSHPEFRRFELHDIGLVPLKNDTAFRKDIAAQVTKQLATELNKRGWYVIHMINESDLASPEKLSNIDAVLKGSVFDYRDVEPLKLGVKLALLDINTKETIWSAQEVFDAASVKLTESVNYYYRGQVDKRNPIMGHKLYLISINKFTEYALSTVVDTLEAAIKEKMILDQKEMEEQLRAERLEEKKARDAEFQALGQERIERVRQKEEMKQNKGKSVESATLILGG